ncbi:MAG: acyl-CoA dehydrogenase, partial [bacterium]|nr:acyl-CoA dehydrogenase [bacterium]
MDFRPSEEQLILLQMVREFADRELRPLAAQWDREARVPDAWVVDKMVEMGLIGMCLPEEYGGGGQDLLSAIICIEQLARVSPLCAASVFESNVGPVRVIELFGSDAQKRRYLPAVCRGEMQISIGMTEAEAGSALTDLRTQAKQVEGGWRIDGRKVFCTGGGHSEAYMVYCRFGEQRGAKGIGAILVEKGTQGLSFGKQEEFMGLRGFPSSELILDGCVVPEENVIVPAGGFGSLMQCFDIERCGNATMALGISQGALEAATDYALERETFGKPIAERQAIQMLLADMATRVDAARLLVHRAAIGAHSGIPSVKETSMA